MPTRPVQMMIWDLGEMKDGLFAVRFPALKILDILFVLVSKAAYTTWKCQKAYKIYQKIPKSKFRVLDLFIF